MISGKIKGDKRDTMIIVSSNDLNTLQKEVNTVLKEGYFLLNRNYLNSCNNSTNLYTMICMDLDEQHLYT